MDSRVDNFTIHTVAERVEIGQTWNGYRGFLDIDKLNMICPDVLEREVFCCGP